jgi:hypothetical protein
MSDLFYIHTNEPIDKRCFNNITLLTLPTVIFKDNLYENEPNFQMAEDSQIEHLENSPEIENFFKVNKENDLDDESLYQFPLIPGNNEISSKEKKDGPSYQKKLRRQN